jgi:hypothetical protein
VALFPDCSKLGGQTTTPDGRTAWRGQGQFSLRGTRTAGRMRIPLQVALGILKPVPAGTLAQFSAQIMLVSWDSHRECR